jgi:hypothetical protein
MHNIRNKLTEYILLQCSFGYIGYRIFIISFENRTEWYGIWLGIVSLLIGFLPLGYFTSGYWISKHKITLYHCNFCNKNLPESKMAMMGSAFFGDENNGICLSCLEEHKDIIFRGNRSETKA